MTQSEVGWGRVCDLADDGGGRRGCECRSKDGTERIELRVREVV